MKVELAPGAAATLRALSRPVRRQVAERLDLLAEVAPKPLAGRPAPFVLDVGGVELVCVRRPGDRLLVVSIDEPGGALRMRVRRIAERFRPDAVPAAPRRTRRPRGLDPRSGRVRAMDLLLELRLAARALRRDSGIIGLAVVVLGVGIGLPAAMYGLVDGLIRQGLNVEDPTRIMHLERRPHGATGEGWGVPPRDVVAWREQQRSFVSLETMDSEMMTVRIGDATDRHSGAWLSGGAFRTLRAQAALGRTLTEEDARPGAEPVAVVSDVLWRNRMGATPSAVGSVIIVEGVPRTVVGVMPSDFGFPANEHLWLPYTIETALAETPSQANLSAFGRLVDGVNLDEARAEFAVIAARTEERWPDTNENLGIAVKPIAERFLGENPVRSMWVFLAAVMLVLLVACANVANLLLVRAVRRVRDLAVRAALGASRGRLAVQTLLESGLIAVAGGIVGIGVAVASLRAFRRIFGERLPYWVELALSVDVLLFMAGLTILAAVLAGLVPALRAGRGDLQTVLRDESRGSTGVRVGRIMRALVVVEMAVSVALLAATGLLARSALQTDPDRLGLPWRDVLTARVALTEESEPDARARYYEQLETALSSDPAVADVALMTSLPATRAGVTRVAVEGTTYEAYDNQPITRFVAVTPSFFDVWETPFVRGRAFNAAESADGAPAVILNAPLARALFGEADPIGRRVKLGRAEDEPYRTVVGIVPAIWAAGLDTSPDRNPPAAYVPLAQSPPQTAAIALRTRGAPLAAVSMLRDVVSSIDADVPLYGVDAMAAVVEDNSWFYGMGASIFALSGIATLLLATVGMYGVISFSVSQRTREYGIRMAMGARPRDILRLVVRRGAGEVVAGMAIGVGLAVAIARGISSMLFGVRPSDPLVIGGTIALLAAVATAAMLIPARRAARSDPLDALRAD